MVQDEKSWFEFGSSRLRIERIISFPGIQTNTGSNRETVTRVTCTEKPRASFVSLEPNCWFISQRREVVARSFVACDAKQRSWERSRINNIELLRKVPRESNYLLFPWIELRSSLKQDTWLEMVQSSLAEKSKWVALLLKQRNWGGKGMHSSVMSIYLLSLPLLKRYSRIESARITKESH
jgi:hypothetical protein